MTRRLALVLLVSLASTATTASAADLGEAWLRVQFALTSQDRNALEVRGEELLDAGSELAVERMTPYAAALVMWAGRHFDDMGKDAVQLARRLDPQLPAAVFLEARWRWREGARLGAVAAYVQGWYLVFRADDARGTLVRSLGSWGLLSLAFALLVSALLLTVTHVRKLLHDARELGRVVFKPANAVVFAAVVLLLPLFAGLGPLWLVVYLFVLTWVYMRPAHRVAAVVICVVLALIFPALEQWQRTALRTPRLTDRVTNILDNRQLDFSTLRELGDLEPELTGVARFHLVYGELLRMHGDIQGAQRQFQQAALADGSSVAALVFLGNLAVEEGDYARALEYYNSAVQRDGDSALAYYNLSTAYDLNRRFQDGDEARRRARELAGRRPRELGLPGADERIRFPRLGSADVQAMVQAIPQETRIKLGLGGFGVRWDRVANNPFTVLFVVSVVLGCVFLLLRSRWMWTASACSRCGRIFCPRCKTATESTIYCSQCISVFLKRDVVSIEQQSAKLEQIRRWEGLTTTLHRLVGVLVPGGGAILGGRVWVGMVTVFLAVLLLGGGLLWVPRFLPSMQPLATVLPIQAALLVVFAALWILSVTRTWARR